MFLYCLFLVKEKLSVFGSFFFYVVLLFFTYIVIKILHKEERMILGTYQPLSVINTLQGKEPKEDLNIFCFCADSPLDCLTYSYLAAPNYPECLILFEANKNKDDVNALTGLHDAMKTLEKCYLLNKKKFYHAKKYAEFALYLAKVKNIKDYIEQAIKWLEDDSMYDNTTGANRKDLLKKLKQNL